MTEKTGGAAFPVPATELHGTHTGMSLRDFFAAKAMQGMLSNEQCKPFDMSFSEEYHANCAYRMADAMLKARG
ncbi:hypothetical protein LG195_03090 [Proteus terrae]|uniref:hypothetical protein n=1 Tax=Proteus terrae TaxID=1574161 RepID=UPI00207C7DFA|nr:hypothetical protein [Proteus terrae]MCO4179222.1 hypothetical protein [Proteus terrae]MCO4188047.1 hypothetical protein [Proteus terrae]